MYNKILVPIDLHNQESSNKALASAASVAKDHHASITLFGMYSSYDHDGSEFKNVLDTIAKSLAAEHAIEVDTLPEFSSDIPAELKETLEEEVQKGDFDLVVMASHTPGPLERFFTSNAGHVAMHSKASVFVVRQ